MYSLQTSVSKRFIYRWILKNVIMKIKVVNILFILISIVSCNEKVSLDYDKIDEEINLYTVACGFKKYEYVNSGDLSLAKYYSDFSDDLLHFDWLMSNCLKKDKKNKKNKNSVDYVNAFLMKKNISCFKKLGEIEEATYLDSNYYYKKKEYIDCILNSFKFGDTIISVYKEIIVDKASL